MKVLKNINNWDKVTKIKTECKQKTLKIGAINKRVKKRKNNFKYMKLLLNFNFLINKEKVGINVAFTYR